MAKRDFIEEVLEFNRAAGRPETWTPRGVEFHTGMQLEELSEKLKACIAGATGQLEELHVWKVQQLLQEMELIGKEFKSGLYTDVVAKGDRHEMLDGDIDVCVVSIGSMQTAGAEVVNAMLAVSGANMAKKAEDGTFHKDTNGKIMKPPGWKPADLTPFVGK